MRNAPAVIALDLGTKTGWAVLRGGRVTSGTCEFKPGRFEGGGMRFLRFARWLDDLRELVGGTIGGIYFEEVRRHVATDAAHVYGGLLGTLTSWCEQHGVPYSGIPVATIKKAATGKGNADKAAMIAAIRRVGFDPRDDNEADAIALLRYVSPQAAAPESA